MGFIGLSNKFIKLIKKKIYLIEDVCESVGTKLVIKKLEHLVKFQIFILL